MEADGVRLARIEERMRAVSAAHDELDREHGKLSGRVRQIELAREREAAREEERASLAVRAAAHATASERKRWAGITTIVALLTVISPHIHHLP